MSRIIYYVATSIDEFISGPGEDISGFVGEGNGLEKYMQDLEAFDTVIMGRKTYEFGYKFGLKPGEPAYPNMTHYIFSNSLTFEEQASNIFIKSIKLEEVEMIKGQSESDIYLCGGGTFAGWLLENRQIDLLKIKLNPLILGEGIKLFDDSTKDVQTELMDTELYDEGLQIMTYRIKY